MNVDEIVRRFQALKADRTDVEELWRLSERFIRPLSGRFYAEAKEFDAKPDWRRREIYDGTAPLAAQTLAASIQGNLMSSSYRWFDFRYANATLGENKDNDQWLEDATEAVFYALTQSNFDEMANEDLLDLVSFGNGVMVEEWDQEEQELDFIAVPTRECFFELDSSGNVHHFYRKLEWTAVQIVEKFGIENVPRTVQDAYKGDKSITRRFELCFAVYTRDPKEVGPIDISQPAPPERLPIGYKYVLVAERAMCGEEGGYYEMPVFFARWRTTAGSVWGHGPGAAVLSSIMTLNQWQQAMIESAEKMLEPPIITTQQGLIGDLDIRRGGINVVADMNDLNIMPVGGDITVGDYIAQTLIQMIRRAFYEDQLELKDSPAMTATEVNVRYELMQRLLGPTLGRLIADWLSPMLQRTLNILIRQGVIPMPPQEVITEGNIDVEYVGPLPRAQKADKAASILGLVGQIASIIEVFPDAADVIDLDQAFREIADLTGVPANVLNSQEQVQAIRDARAEQMRQMQEIEQTRAAGEAAQQVVGAAQGASSLPPEVIQALQGSVPPRDIR